MVIATPELILLYLTSIRLISSGARPTLFLFCAYMILEGARRDSTLNPPLIASTTDSD